MRVFSQFAFVRVKVEVSLSGAPPLPNFLSPRRVVCPFFFLEMIACQTASVLVPLTLRIFYLAFSSAPRQCPSRSFEPFLDLDPRTIPFLHVTFQP